MLTCRRQIVNVAIYVDKYLVNIKILASLLIYYIFICETKYTFLYLIDLFHLISIPQEKLICKYLLRKRQCYENMYLLG